MKLNKPIYIGVSILELSKLHMYKYHYDVMKKKYDDKINLLYTDTDSFIYHIETEDSYKDFDDMKEHMDFSGYDTAKLHTKILRFGSLSQEDLMYCA